MFIFLDESGDLGFDFKKRKTTKKFVITLLVCESDKTRREFTNLNISHLTSQESAGLQAVDLFSWGIFRKYEYNDYGWYTTYRDKIRFETEYLP